MTNNCLQQIEQTTLAGNCEYKHAGLYVDYSSILPNELALLTKDFIPAQTVLSIQQCSVSPFRTRTSIQVSPNIHAEADDCIRFANHSCQPNAGVFSKYLPTLNYATIVLFSLRDIAMGDEIQFDYATTESTLTNELLGTPCLCNSQKCRNVLTGFEELLEVDKKLLIESLPVAHYLL